MTDDDYGSYIKNKLLSDGIVNNRKLRQNESENEAYAQELGCRSSHLRKRLVDDLEFCHRLGTHLRSIYGGILYVDNEKKYTNEPLEKILNEIGLEEILISVVRDPLRHPIEIVKNIDGFIIIKDHVKKIEDKENKIEGAHSKPSNKKKQKNDLKSVCTANKLMEVFKFLHSKLNLLDASWGEKEKRTQIPTKYEPSFLLWQIIDEMARIIDAEKSWQANLEDI